MFNKDLTKIKTMAREQAQHNLSLDVFAPQPLMDEQAARAAVEVDLVGVQFRQPVVEYVPPAEPKPSRMPQPVRRVLDRVSSLVARRRHQVETGPPTRVEFEDDYAADTWARNADRQWGLVTAVATDIIRSDSSARRALVDLVAEPLSEDLPLRAIRGLATEGSRLSRVLGRTGTLTTMLALPSIPDEAIVPDIKHAFGVTRREGAVDSLVRSKQFGGYEHLLANTRTLAPLGMTEGEKVLALRRFKYARDAKLLGLMAELYGEPDGGSAVVQEGGLIARELASGTKLVMTDEAHATEPQLLDPASWQRREQLKDRVYRVWVDDKSYVLKERKTERHADTKKDGHVYGNTSEQEFAAAREFADLGVVREDDTELRWEKPLGYVEFPDGYQFCLFEDDTAVDGKFRTGDISRVVRGNPDRYQAEYEEVRATARKIKAERPDLVKERRYADVDAGPDELSYDDFARLKEYHLKMAAEEFLDETASMHGYARNDDYNYGFVTREEDGRAVVELINFDLEYYLRNPGAASARLERRQALQADGEYARMHVYGSNFSRANEIMKAASYAMMERIGWTIPPQDDVVTRR